MGALILILPILVVAGAFMWLKPSKREQELAKLRSNALVRGLRIGSLKVPDLSEYGRINQKQEIVTIYQKSLREPRDETSRFTVVRTTGESGAYLPDEWAWHQRHLLDEAQYGVLADWLRKLPESVTVVALARDSVALSWDERDPGVSFDTLEGWLDELAGLFHRQAMN